ncbi:MAG: phosphoglycerate kinase [Planctomycetes bacterium]|nr:phosphoglycerate kinase [Planctomycetota bacterium]
MVKKSVDQIDARGKRVLVRLDLNVPLDGAGGIADDKRIVAALPTIKRLIDDGGRVVLMSHLGRPMGEPEDRRRFSLAPVAKRLSELLGRPVKMMSDCIGETVRAHVDAMTDGDVCLLENLRFHTGETIKDKNADTDAALRTIKDHFAAALASLGDAFVNDAFGTCHRDNASMVTVPKMMQGKPRVVGYLVQKELRFLGEALADPARPFVCILGGAKVSGKLEVIHSLLKKCDTILVGGAMANTFLAAEGQRVGASLVEPDLFETARELRVAAVGRLRVPVDTVAAAEIREGIETRICEGSIPDGLMALDIGPGTVAAYEDVIATAKTIVWNGPMGVFETSPFDAGTIAIAQAVAAATDRGAVTVIGGGDSAAAVAKAGLTDRMTHVSTGGGASLEFLEGKAFEAISVLDDA